MSNWFSNILQWFLEILGLNHTHFKQEYGTPYDKFDIKDKIKDEIKDEIESEVQSKIKEAKYQMKNKINNKIDTTLNNNNF